MLNNGFVVVLPLIWWIKIYKTEISLDVRLGVCGQMSSILYTYNVHVWWNPSIQLEFLSSFADD